MKIKNIIAFSMMSFVLMLSVVVALAFSAREGHGESTVSMAPTNMTGTWRQIDGNANENMVATIDHGKIQITLYLGEMGGVYWDGSFDFDKPHVNAGSFDVVSETNHANDMFSSDANNKTFSYKNGILSYQFKIVGTTRTIQLQKEGS